MFQNRWTRSGDTEGSVFLVAPCRLFRCPYSYGRIPYGTGSHMDGHRLSFLTHRR